MCNRQRVVRAGVVRHRGGFAHRDDLCIGAQNGFPVGVQCHEAEAATVIVGSIPAELAKVCGADDVAFRHGRGRVGAVAVGIPLQGSTCAVTILGGDLLDADEGRGLAGCAADEQFLFERQCLVVRDGQRAACAGVFRRGRGFVDADGLRLNAHVGLSGAVQGHKAEAAALVAHGVPGQLAEVFGRDGLADRDGRGRTVAQQLQGRACTVMAAGLNGLDADGNRLVVLVRAGKGAFREGGRLLVGHGANDRISRVDRRGGRFVHRDGLFRCSQNGFPVGVQRHEAEAATVVVGAVPAELAEVFGADDIAFRDGGRRAGAVAVGVPLQGRARAGVTLRGDLLDADEGRGLVSCVAGKQLLAQSQRLVVCDRQWFTGGRVVRGSRGFADRDGLRGGPQNGLLVGVQRHEAEAATVVVGGVPAELAKVCGADDIALLNGRGCGGTGPIIIPLQGGAGAVAILGRDALDADEGRGLVGGVAGKQVLTQRQRLVVCHRQWFTGGGIVRGCRGFADRDGLRGGAQNGLLIGVQRHEAEAATVVVGGIPAELAKVCRADDIAFRDGRRGTGTIAVGVPLQGSARAVVTLGGDLLDADKGWCLVGSVAGKQFLTQRQRLVVRHRQWVTRAGVVRHGGGFVDVDGLRLDAVIGLTLAVQRHKAEAAAVVVGAVPDQTAEICGGNLLVLGNRGQRSVVGAQMQRGRSGTGALGLDAFNAHVRRGMFGILAGERAGAQLHRLVVTGRTGRGGVVIAGRNRTRRGGGRRFGCGLWRGLRCWLRSGLWRRLRGRRR